MGLEKFAAAAAAAGADGVLATDLTPEEAARISRDAAGARSRHDFSGGAHFHRCAAGADRERSSGFLYLISRAGVTGARDALPAELPALVRRARKFTTLPIAVGFGISLPTHVTVLGGIADAAVVGSALVAEVEKAASPDAAAAAVAERFATEIRRARWRQPPQQRSFLNRRRRSSSLHCHVTNFAKSFLACSKLHGNPCVHL